MSNTSVEANKAVVRAFFDTSNREGFDRAIAMLDENCGWWTTGGTNSKEQMKAIAAALESQLDEQIQFDIGTMTAEDDRVAVEIKSRALRKNGVRYANVYHFLFRLSDGRIVEVREHNDTAHAMQVWADAFG